jgi:hypothetical protein
LHAGDVINVINAKQVNTAMELHPFGSTARGREVREFINDLEFINESIAGNPS